MRLYSVRFSVLVYSLFLFFMGGISFAKPGDYLVYSLDPKKDSSLKCCCCGDAFSKTYYPGLCFLKYESGENTKDVFEKAKEFNLNEAERLKSKFFDDIKTGDYCSVVEKFKETLAEMKGLFCSHCMEIAFEVAGIFEWREFLYPGVKPRTRCYNFLSNCHICGKELDLYNHVSFKCVKCDMYIYCNDPQCYEGDKDKDSCPVCCKKLKNGNKEAIRRIPYLYDHDIQRTDDTGTEVKIHMNCGLSAGSRDIFNYEGTKFVISYFFVIHGARFEEEIPFKYNNGKIYGKKVPLSYEEKEGYYDIPGKDNSKFYFICHVRSSNGFGLNENIKFTETSKKMCEIYDKRWDGFGWHSNHNK